MNKVRKEKRDSKNDGHAQFRFLLRNIHHKVLLLRKNFFLTVLLLSPSPFPEHCGPQESHNKKKTIHILYRRIRCLEIFFY